MKFVSVENVRKIINTVIDLSNKSDLLRKGEKVILVDTLNQIMEYIDRASFELPGAVG